jgi:hypothetical protein
MAASLNLKTQPPGPLFLIGGSDCAMPKIEVSAEFVDFVPDPKSQLSYEWTVSLNFTGGPTICPNSSAATHTAHTAIRSTTPIGKLLIPFAEVRGGELLIAVEVKGDGVPATARKALSTGLRVLGANPGIAELQAYVPNYGLLRKLMMIESAMGTHVPKQFRHLDPQGYPLFSQDGLQGVGLCQLTYPAPTAAQIWNWKANVDAGLELYKQKERHARNYPARVRKGNQLRMLVTEYSWAAQQDGNRPRAPWLDMPDNNARMSLARPAPTPPRPPARMSPVGLIAQSIEVPDFTPEQIQNDTARGFNGYMGRDPDNNELHEYRLRLDESGALVVKRAANGTLQAEWEQISPEERLRIWAEQGVIASADNERRNQKRHLYVQLVNDSPGF